MRKSDLPRTAKATRVMSANAGLQRAYYRKLRSLVDELAKSAEYWVLAEYKKQLKRAEKLAKPPVTALTVEPATVGDASPASEMLRRLREQARHWKKRFDHKAEIYAAWFAARAMHTATAMSRAALSEAVGYTVPMQMTRNMSNVLDAVVAENVALIKSIPEQYFLEVEGSVLRSVRAGRDLAGLTDDLQARYGITRRRALLIARDQNNKASSAISRARMQDAGVTLGIWRHTGVSKHPRPSHKHADGLVFDLSEGLYLDGKLTYPGEEINCGCRFEAVIERPGGRVYPRKEIDYSRAGRKYLEQWQRQRDAS